VIECDIQCRQSPKWHEPVMRFGADEGLQRGDSVEKLGVARARSH